MGVSWQSEPRRGRAGCWALACLTVFGCALAGTLAAGRLSIPDAHAPYPAAQLYSEQTTWDVRGFHTVRVYRVPAGAMRDVLEWYFDEDIIGRYGPRAVVPDEFDYIFRTPAPAQPLLARLALGRYSLARFRAEPGYVEVSLDTHLYWQSAH